MRTYIKPKTLIMFGMLLCFTSCGTGSCAGWGNAPRMEYYFQGGEISFNEGTTAQVEVLDFTRGLMNNQSYFTDLWRVDADDSDEQYKLVIPRNVSNQSWLQPETGAVQPSPAYALSGTLSYEGAALSFDLQNDVVNSGFINLKVYGTCSISDAQRLVKQVRLPAWNDNTSDDSALMSWTLTGDYDGEPFTVRFTQVFHGKSRYPVYPDTYDRYDPGYV